MSVLGSLGRTAFIEEQEVTALSGRNPLPSMTPTLFLDALSGVERVPDGLALRNLVLRSLPFVRAASVIALVSGSAVDPARVRSACEHYGRDVHVLAVRCEPGIEASRRRIAT